MHRDLSPSRLAPDRNVWPTIVVTTGDFNRARGRLNRGEAAGFFPVHPGIPGNGDETGTVWGVILRNPDLSGKNLAPNPRKRGFLVVEADESSPFAEIGCSSPTQARFFPRLVGVRMTFID